MKTLIKSSLVFATLMASTSALASTPDWKVSEASGSVSIVRDGKVLTAKENSALEAGDVIRTGDKGRAVLVRGKEFVVVSPRAELQLAEPEKTGPVIQFFQNIGNALFKIEKKATPHFGVKTPYLAAVVKGTTFNVSVSQAKASVQVTEGAVEVATNDDLEAALLTPGLVGLVGADSQDSLVVIAGNRASGDMSGTIVRGTPDIVTSAPVQSSRAEAPGLQIAAANASENSRVATFASLDTEVVSQAGNGVFNANDNGAANSDRAGNASGNGNADFGLETAIEAVLGAGDGNGIGNAKGNGNGNGNGNGPANAGRNGGDETGTGATVIEVPAAGISTGVNGGGNAVPGAGIDKAKGQNGSDNDNGRGKGAGGSDELDGSGVEIGIDAGKSGDIGESSFDAGVTGNGPPGNGSPGNGVGKGRGKGGPDDSDDINVGIDIGFGTGNGSDDGNKGHVNDDDRDDDDNPGKGNKGGNKDGNRGPDGDELAFDVGADLGLGLDAPGLEEGSQGDEGNRGGGRGPAAGEDAFGNDQETDPQGNGNGMEDRGNLFHQF